MGQLRLPRHRRRRTRRRVRQLARAASRRSASRRLAEYRERIAKHYAKLALPGGGTARKGDKFDVCGRA